MTMSLSVFTVGSFALGAMMSIPQRIVGCLVTLYGQQVSVRLPGVRRRTTPTRCRPVVSVV
jgi:hypothetical protein